MRLIYHKIRVFTRIFLAATSQNLSFKAAKITIIAIYYFLIFLNIFRLFYLLLYDTMNIIL